MQLLYTHTITFSPHSGNIMQYKWLYPTPLLPPQPVSHMVDHSLKAFVVYACPAQWITKPQREHRGGGGEVEEEEEEGLCGMGGERRNNLV